MHFILALIIINCNSFSQGILVFALFPFALIGVIFGHWVHGRVLENPAPKVLFMDFGDNALIFRALFWIQMSPNSSFLEIESDLRHRINHLLGDAGITIAFPQRDVHLDTLRPLDVRVIADSNGAG